MSRLLVLPLLALAALAVSSVPVSAHAPSVVPVVATVADIPSTSAWHAAPTPPALPWTVIAAAALAATVGTRRPRRAVALAIVFVLALFAYETGVHSVHHLNDRAASAACVVASGATHVAGTPVDVGAVEPLILASLERLVLDSRPNVEVRSLAVHQGRAPPLAA
jgi:hypothetical protein